MMNKERAREKLNRKKAQIGATITWIGAFLIIFFILLLFLSASVIISKSKKVLGANYRISAETIEQEPLMQSRMLVSLMNSPIRIVYNNKEKQATIKNTLKILSFSEINSEGIKGQIEKNLLDLTRYSKPECYLFKIESADNQGSDKKIGIEFGIEGLVGAGGRRYSQQFASGFYDKADIVYIQGKEIQMGVKLFAGRC